MATHPLWQQLLLLLLLLLCFPTLTPALEDSVLYHLQEASPATAVLFPWVVQCIGVIVFFNLTRFEIPLPYAACMFLIGTFAGLGAVLLARKADTTESLDQLSMSILQWSNINSAVLLLVFLPGLIFRDAIEVNFHLFMASLPQLLLLAFPLVLVGTGLTALVGYYVIPYDWPWSLAATLGAILASTDPVAVGSVLKKAGAPPRLQMHVSGESLLNDGSAVVFYTIFSRVYLSELGFGDSVGIGEGFTTFFRMSLGGIAVGIAFAAGLLIILYELDRRLEPEYNVLQVVAALTTAYLSYYVSEQVCTMSGVIACVVCGITARALGRGLITDNQLMDSYLSLMEHLLNSLLFALGGVVWGKVIASPVIDGEDWLYLLLVYVLVMVIRFIQIGLFFPVFSRVGLKSNWREAIFLGYGGLRGAVGVALALSLTRSVREVTEDEDSVKATETLEFLAGGVTLLTLFVNGSTAGPVLKWLGLVHPVQSRKRALRLFRTSAESFVANEYKKVLKEQRFNKISYRVIKAHVPFVTANPAFESEELLAVEDDHSTHTERYIQLLSPRGEACPEGAVVEMRQLFLELLSQAYCKEMTKGELHEREDSGFNADLLMQSVLFAAADVDHQEPIHDWEYINNFRLYEDAKSFVIRKYQQATGRKQDACWTFHYQKKRTAVIRALAFIEAHRLAEKRLKSYVDSFASISVSMEEEFSIAAFRSATEIVLDESAKQVAEAQKILDRIACEQLHSMISHYACTILLHRLATFVERNTSDGILTKKEAKVFLKRIDRSVQATHTCNCNADPPGTCETCEADDSSTPQEGERGLESVNGSTT